MSPAVRAVLAVAALVIAGCAHLPARPTAAKGISASTSELVAAVRQEVTAFGQQRDAQGRMQLLEQARRNAAACVARDPNAGACHYVQGMVLGLTAQERPLQAAAILKDMLASLARAEALDAGFDHAGAARLSAVVLLRAPPWPLGPGDLEQAVAAARRAVKRDPAYPPNLLILAQALGRSGADAAARTAFDRARDAALALPAGEADRDEWLRQAQQGSASAATAR